MPWRGRNSIELSSQELRTRLPANATPDAAGVDGRLRAELQGRGPGLGDRSGGLSVTSGASQHKEQCTARGLRESVTWRGVASRCPRLAQSVRWSKQRGERCWCWCWRWCWCWCWPCWVLVTAWPMAHGSRMGRSVQCWPGRHGGLNPGCLQETWIFFWRRCNLLADLSPANLRCTVPLLPR